MQPRRINLITDGEGQLFPIPDALRTELSAAASANGAHLHQVVDHSDAFLKRISDGNFICDVPLEFHHNGQTTTFNFAGGKIGPDRYLLVGTDAADPFIPFYEALAHLEDNQVNNLREAMRGEGIQRRVDQRDPSFGAMSALNNEMMTLQRALAKSNIEVKAQRDRFHITLASIRDAVIATDDAGRITFMNAIAEELTQWTKDEAQGLPIQEVFKCVEPLERTPISMDVMQRLDKGELIALPETMLLQCKLGGERAVEDSIAGIYHQSGKLIGMVLVFRDVSERWQMERERAQLLEQEQNARLSAESALELRRKFVAMISHELRAPLTAIKGFVTTLLLPDSTWDEYDQRDFLETINQEADKLDSLIEQMLDLSRLQTTGFKINRKRASLDEALQSAMPQIKVLAHNHQLELDVPADLPSIQLDIIRISQVLVNLVGNAAKYTPTGTKITVAAYRDTQHLCVEVRDQGSGIAPDEREKIFDAFHQVSLESRPKGGVGLGLAICKAIVEAHQGRIWVEDNEPHGAVFKFTLPLAPQQPDGGA